MLNPHPIRIRSQSNPPRPNFTRPNSTPPANPSPSTGLTPRGSRPATAGSTPVQTPRLEFTPLPTVQQQRKQSISQPQNEEKKPPKKLQRSSRSSLLSSSTSHLPLPITQAPISPPLNPMQPKIVPLVHEVTQPQPNGPKSPPPPRPPRNPARTLTNAHSSGGRPSSSSSGRDHKAFWDPTQQTGPLLSKFVRRHKSVSANVNGFEKDKGKRRMEDTSPLDVRKQGRGTIGARPSTADHSNSLAFDSNKRLSSKSNLNFTQPSWSLRATQSLSLSPTQTPDPLQEPLIQRPTPTLHTSSREPLSSTNTGTLPAKDKGKEKAGPNFSTLDRTILEELKLALTARESQFVYKGQGSGGGMGIGAMNRRGERHHPYPKQEVPYPRSYERGVVDL